MMTEELVDARVNLEASSEQSDVFPAPGAEKSINRHRIESKAQEYDILCVCNCIARIAVCFTFREVFFVDDSDTRCRLFDRFDSGGHVCHIPRSAEAQCFLLAPILPRKRAK